MSKENWVSQVFQTSEAGVSSAFEPELIPDNQLAWMKNGVIRGGKPHTRTPLRFRLTLPRGKLQGVGFFSIQNGMLVVSIGGNIYRIRVGTKTSGFSYEEIPLEWRNSATQDFAWMQETVGYLVIQDGQSDAIIYDGSVARRSDTAEDEVPLGRQMAYGNGRLWVAINEQELVAGDIKTRTPGSELLFTETQYLTGGGAFYFPRKITALGFIPATGAAGYGSLIVYAKDRTETIRADITNRDLWGTFPGFIQPALLNTGAASQFSLTEVNQDLWWRDAQGGIRSLRSAVTDESSGPGNTPQSREVARITDFEDQKRLASVSAIQFDNRLLMTASPFINEYGATSFRDIISLDFSPISSNRSKTAPSYDGEWEGLEFTRLVAGEFNGRKRGFALSLDPDGYNRLWEFDDGVNDDELQICTGTGLATLESPIPMVMEYPSRDFGTPNARKVLQRCDVYLAGIEGEVSLDVYWRSDNLVKWNQWQEEVTACAIMSDDSTETPHVWKNLAPQGRAQIKTFSIPQTTQPLTGYGNQTGFEHQIRIVVTGKARVDRVVVHASVATQEQFALRDNASFSVCAEQDITGNEVVYDPVSAGCSMQVGTALCTLEANLAPIYPGTWTLSDYPVGVDPSEVLLENESPSDNLSVTVPEMGLYTFRLHAGTRVIDYPYEFVCEGQYFIDLTGIASDGSGLDGALSVGVYAYDGVAALRLLGRVGYEFFGTVVDITAMVKIGWTVQAQAVVFLAEFYAYGIYSEIPLVTSLASSEGVTLGELTGVSGEHSGPLDVDDIEIPDVETGSFVANVSTPEPVDPPDNVPNLVAWYDASQLVGYSNNDIIGTWSDLSPSAGSMNPTQSTRYITNAQNSLPCARFTKSPHSFFTAINNISKGDIFIACKITSAVFSGAFFKMGILSYAAQSTFAGVDATTNWDSASWPIGTVYYLNGIVTTNTAALLSPSIYNLKLGSISALGSLIVNSGNNPAPNGCNMDLYEIAIYDRVLSDDERLGITNYFKLKWGIA